MKKYIVLIFISSILTSCGHGEDKFWTDFIIKNNFERTVKLTVFNGKPLSESFRKDSTYIILPSKYISDGISDKGWDTKYLLPCYGADSVHIVFDDMLQIVYRKGDSNPRNILNISSYTDIIKGEAGAQYTYNITEDDYKNAKPIK